MPLRVSEIFLSIQGESTHAGLPCAFIRLAGCNLRCSYCDTAYALEGGQEMGTAEAAECALAFGVPLVEVTGGEPLLQEEAYPLMEALLAAGATVLLETNGSLPVGRVDPRVARIIDVKCPGSGFAHCNDWSNMALLRATDEVKFVLADRADYDFARGAVRHYGLLERCPVLFAPAWGEPPQRLEPRQLAEWMLEDRLAGVRLQLQLHKLIWGQARGR
jgi:7-carboxy-7-deazaguanine synthase